jgi:long-subunit fatty acid transport protein
MAGASTAVAADAAGATYWNPASICYIKRTEMYVGADFVYAETGLDAAVEAIGQIGTDRSDSGLASAPAIGVVYRPEESLFRYGLGIYGLVGRTVNFRGNDTNPILSAWNPPNSFGVGPVSTSFSALQIAPILGYQLSEKLYVGGGPVVTTMTLLLDPALQAERNSNGTFPPATNSRPRWGFGFQVGFQYHPDSPWSFGGSFKSRQWFDTFKYDSKDEIGNARTLETKIELPLIISGGVAYHGFEKTLIAVDLRYFNYKNAKLFGDPPEQGGLGWTNIVSVAAGLQRDVHRMLKVQGGYLYNGKPIPETETLWNIQLPAINTHTISAGLVVALTDYADISGSIAYAFKSNIAGTIQEIPGTFIQLRQDLTTFSLGLTFHK